MVSSFWKHSKVLVTGGTGFIGSHVVEKLVKRGAKVTVFDNLQNGKVKNLDAVKSKISLLHGDCMNMPDALHACKNNAIVMSLAARVGGIEYNRMHHATMLRDNLTIAITMIEAARQMNVERFLVVSSACVYSGVCCVPTPESEGFVGEPEGTNGGYGWAKRMAEKLGSYYAQEFGMKIGIVRPYNCYGPRDHFDPKTSHVIPALIKRVFEGENPVHVWGSGKQTRAFLYVEDLAEGMIRAIEKYPKPDPINLGSDEEVTIAELVNSIVRLSKINTKITYDRDKPDGSPRRNCDTSKAKKCIGYTAKTPLDVGLKKTMAWYRDEYHQ